MKLSRIGRLKVKAGTWLSNCLSVSSRATSIGNWKRRHGKIVFINGPPFELQSLNNEKYDETEALATFAVGVAAVAREYHVNCILRPHFVLVLGSDKDDISWPQGNDWAGGEIRLRKWDKRLFRAGVIALTINELTKPRNVLRLERQIEHRENTTIEVKSLRR